MVLKITLFVLLLLVGGFVIFPVVYGITQGMFSFSGGGSGGVGEFLIHYSSNAGESWRMSSRSENANEQFPSRITRIVFHPSDPNVMYVGTQGGGLWKSATKGASWRKVFDSANALLPTSDIYAIAVSSVKPEVLYVAANQADRGRVFRSDDAGASYREIYQVSADNFSVFDIAIHQSDPESAVITTGQGALLETRDGGKTWRAISWLGRVARRIIMNPRDFKEMYVVDSSNGILRSRDGGKNWIDIRVNATGPAQASSSPAQFLAPRSVFDLFGGYRSDISLFISDPKDFNTVYAGSSQGIFRSRDGGDSWAALPVIIPPSSLPPSAVAPHPRDSGVLFVATTHELYKSTDAGGTWSVASLSLDGALRTLYIHPADPVSFYALTDK